MGINPGKPYKPSFEGCQWQFDVSVIGVKLQAELWACEAHDEWTPYLHSIPTLTASECPGMPETEGFSPGCHFLALNNLRRYWNLEWFPPDSHDIVF